VIRSPAKQSGIEPVFSKTTKQQELGVAVHAPAKSGIWLILDATSKKAKRKAPYFKRSTVLFWWRIVAGLSDWGCVLIPTGLPAELIPHKIQEANLLDGVFC
jgi:hypothetical protein